MLMQMHFMHRLLDINCIDYPVYVHFGRIRSGSNYCPPMVSVLYYTRSWLDQLFFFFLKTTAP